MAIIKIPCPYCGKEALVQSNVLIPKFGKTVKLECKNTSCGKLFSITINEEFAAKVNLFSHLSVGTKTVIEIPKDKEKNTVNNAFLKNGDSGESYKLSEGINVIGRQSLIAKEQTLGIITDDTTMSRIHCEIVVNKNSTGLELILSDKKSKNRTYLNDDKEMIKQNEKIFLNDGDCLLLGQTKIYIQIK